MQQLGASDKRANLAHAVPRRAARMNTASRRNARVKFKGGLDATIMALDGSWRLCRVVDIDHSGATIRLDEASAGASVHGDFFLLFSAGGQVRRRCRLIRDTGDEAAIEFVTSAARKGSALRSLARRRE
jgi:hypothetical protein